MAHLLGAQNISLNFPNRTLLDDITIGVDRGDRIGVVGRNGDGKSTFLNILAGNLQPDSGEVTKRSGVTVGILTQEDDFVDTDRVQDIIAQGRPEYEWAQDVRTRTVLNGLIPELGPEFTVSQLSGGQRRRLALAHLLIQDWDIIMLDEPTNHLDLGGVRWLADHLKQRWPKNQGALLTITHDRWFLDEVTEYTWEVHDGTIDVYEGGYAAYVLQRVERQRQQDIADQKRQNLLRKELAWLRRGAPARTAKPKFRIDAANALIADVPEIRNAVQLTQLATTRLGKDVIDVQDASVEFSGRTILKDVNWNIAPGERTGILGANGAGKSTLLALLTKQLDPTSGRVKQGKTVQFGILDQRFDLFEEIENDRVREVLSRFKTYLNVAGNDLSPSQLLERLGFSSEHFSTRVKDLSGGQRRRLQLLMVLLEEPNVLILDEPTNDVDTDMLNALEDFLDSWPGTLIVVSHDRYLLERITDQQYAVLNGNFRHLPGGIDEFLRLYEANQRSRGAAMLSESASEEDNAISAVNTQPALSGAERRTLEKEVSSIERRLAKLKDSRHIIHDNLASHDQSDFEGLHEFTKQLQDIDTEVDSLEERWLELAELLE